MNAPGAGPLTALSGSRRAKALAGTRGEERALHRNTSMPRDNRSVDGIVEHVRALPMPDQLEVFRRIAPRILAELGDDARDELVDEINQAIAQHETTLRAPRR